MDDEIAALREDIAGAQRDQARAAERYAQALARRDAAAAALAEEFGVADLESGRALEDQLDKELCADVAGVRRNLDLATSGGRA